MKTVRRSAWSLRKPWLRLRKPTDGQVADLQCFILSGGKIPPITITSKGVVVDGWKRVLAFRNMAISEIECVVKG